MEIQKTSPPPPPRTRTLALFFIPGPHGLYPTQQFIEPSSMSVFQRPGVQMLHKHQDLVHLLLYPFHCRKRPFVDIFPILILDRVDELLNSVKVGRNQTLGAVELPSWLRGMSAFCSVSLLVGPGKDEHEEGATNKVLTT